MLGYVHERIESALRRAAQVSAEISLSRRKELWDALNAYRAKTQSTGCGSIDYWALYRTVRNRRPTEVLECGTGVTTLIIAHALMENEREGGIRGRVTSMEESGRWLEMSQALLPQLYHQYVDFCLSGTVEDHFSLFRGVRYRELPPRSYDFIFVDGPKYISPLDSVPTFDFDVIHVLKTATKPVTALIDKRVSTCFVLQQILGSDKLRYSMIKHLGVMAPCTSADLGRLQVQMSSANFLTSFRLLGRTKLYMSPPVQ